MSVHGRLPYLIVMLLITHGTGAGYLLLAAYDSRRSGRLRAETAPPPARQPPGVTETTRRSQTPTVRSAHPQRFDVDTAAN